MRIDLTCPVELWQYAMPTEDDAECTFVMNNLSDKVVTSVQVTLACYDRENQQLFRQTERIQGLKADVGERFTIMLLPSQWRGVEGVDLMIEKVWFDDASVWRKGNAPLTRYESNALPKGRALDELRFVAGQDAVGYPQTQEEVWVCVCGRANALDSQRCCRCERRREAVFASYSPDNVNHVIAAHEQKLSQTARKAHEENNLVQEKLEKQHIARRRRRKQTLRLTLSLAAVAAIAVAAVAWGIPALRYYNAQSLLSQARYDEARAAFAQMGSYGDAQAQLLRCDYLEALDALNAGDADSLMDAAERFLALQDYEDSHSQWQKATYALGKMYLETGEYDLAADSFQTLGDYEDSETLVQESAYRQAMVFLEAGSYDAARALFASIPDYQDAHERYQQCYYDQGKAYLENGEYTQAVECFYAVGEYADAMSLISQAYYALAENALAAGDYEAAGENYLLAGDYEDAPAKANECLYQQAQSLASEGDYERAAELFLRIAGYLDSEGQAQLCLYRQAQAHIQAGDDAAALALLETITNYNDAMELIYQCRYRLALAAREEGDLLRAEELLEDVDDYEDSDDQLTAVRYAIAEEAWAREDYATAEVYYAAVSGYEDSRSKLNQARYALAQQSMTAGDYAAAANLYEQLGDYEDSAEQLEEARYQEAMALLEAGNEMAAAQALATLPDSERAQEALKGLYVAQAGRMMEAGDYEAAAEQYQLAGDEDGYRRSLYAQAEQSYNEGALAAAAAAFAALGDYEDAAERAQACYDQYLGDAPKQARAASEAGDALGVINALRDVDLTGLTGEYADLETLWLEACYSYADELYNAGRPYEALPYYQAVGDYRDTPTEKLGRRAYLILGEWESSSGLRAVFETDGACDLMGEALCFRVSNFSVYTGQTADAMTVTHQITTLNDTSLTIRDLRSGTVYRFTRTSETGLPLIPLPQSVEAEDAQDA